MHSGSSRSPVQAHGLAAKDGPYRNAITAATYERLVPFTRGLDADALPERAVLVHTARSNRL
uniref:Uncharacterized protein n=1 Tax=Bionectria ochroleuca TaxID=29856 RepID=A0A0B7JWC3_BIOOC